MSVYVSKVSNRLTYDIGAFHLTVTIPDPEKEALKEQDIQEDLVPEGFEAGDPQSGLLILREIRLLSPLIGGYRMILCPLKRTIRVQTSHLSHLVPL
jgi:hypothetical protein